MTTAADFLRRIEPRQVDNRGRWKPVPEARLRAFEAVKDVLTTTGAQTDLRTAVATRWLRPAIGVPTPLRSAAGGEVACACE